MIKKNNDKKKILIKMLFRTNLPWFIAISAFAIFFLIMIFATTPWILSNKDNIFFNSNIDSYGKFSIWVCSMLKNGMFSFANYSFTSRTFFTILVVGFFINLEYKIRTVYFKKHTMQLIKDKNIKYIPIISSISLCSYVFVTFILIDIVVFGVLKDVRSQFINYNGFEFEDFNINYWKSEFLVIIKNAIHYIFLIGLIYILIDLYRYKINNAAWIKISLIILVFLVVIPFILIMLWSTIFNTYPNHVLLKSIQLTTTLLNPFDTSFIGASPLYDGKTLVEGQVTNEFVVENIQNIKWILKGIYTGFSSVYVVIHFAFKNAKYE